VCNSSPLCPVTYLAGIWHSVFHVSAAPLGVARTCSPTVVHILLSTFATDFTVWATLHPGGPVKIGQFAVNGTYNLQFPSWHPMSRWTSNANSRNDIINLGRLGDVVDFATFPTSLQPETIATAIGADRNAASNGDGQEVCGSPGEVPNNPTKGARYSYSLGDGLQDSHRDQQLDRNGTMHTTNAKSIVWSNVVLKSADQLRQRMAWALSQIFVVNTDGVGRNSETEFWVNYYDIFVRHAFGNYRDVMKEVSYSAVMGRMLSFTNTRSVGSSGFFPDENYAREIMQLFSVSTLGANLAPPSSFLPPLSFCPMILKVPLVYAVFLPPV
jgi:hypothetical protein